MLLKRTVVEDLSKKVDNQLEMIDNGENLPKKPPLDSTDSNNN